MIGAWTVNNRAIYELNFGVAGVREVPLWQVHEGGQKWNEFPSAIKRDGIMESGSLASLSF